MSTCDSEFCPSCIMTGYCDNTCADVACQDECQITQSPVPLSCANAGLLNTAALGGFAGKCALLIAEGECTTCPSCGAVPRESIADDGPCLAGLVPTVQRAAQACLNSTTLTGFACEAAGCPEVMDDVNVLYETTCSGVDLRQYAPAVCEDPTTDGLLTCELGPGGTEADCPAGCAYTSPALHDLLHSTLRPFEAYCNLNSCMNHYIAILNSCANAVWATSCDNPACDAALEDALETSASCKFADTLNDPTFGSLNIQNFTEWVSNSMTNRNLICGGCLAPTTWTHACNIGGELSCTPESECAGEHQTFFTKFTGECSSLWSTHSDYSTLSRVYTHLHLMCTGEAYFGDNSENQAPSDMAERCLQVHTTAQEHCAAAGMEITSADRCSSPECHSAVNHLEMIHEECLSHYDEIESDWPFAPSDFQAIRLTNECPCMDHELSQYGIGVEAAGTSFSVQQEATSQATR
eukprot:COSAG02_NODE_10632_length_1894_cov_1.656825_3_plen_465_part_01